MTIAGINQDNISAMNITLWFTILCLISY